MVDENRRRRRRGGWRLLIVLILLAVGIGASYVWLAGPIVPEGSYVLLDVGGAYDEQPPDDLVARLTGQTRMSLLDLLLLIRDASEDGRVAGLVVRVRGLDIGWAKAQDIRQALSAFRATGKPVYAYLEQEFSSSTLEYYVASVAESIYVPRGATAMVNGLLAQYVFLGGVWEKLDIDMQVVKIREYKTAGDMLVNKEMSPYHREMANSLLDSLYGQLVNGVAAARGLDAAAVEAAIDSGPATPGELEHLELVDAAKFLDELRVELLGAEEEFLEASDYRERRGELLDEAQARQRIAVVYGVGPITTGSSEGSAFEDSRTMGSETIAKAFREAASDEEIEAIVFRIDSPGGSALASDLIWQATREASRQKPVIVSMSDVAGSGGYYVAAAATEIVAQPGTLTGSIGVVLAKPNIKGFLAMLGVNTATLSRGKLAQVTSLMQSFTSGELGRVENSMDYVYDLFVERVAEGRHLDPEQVREVGRGRVWTGEQAEAKGLVDELGGFLAAIDAAKRAVDIPVAEKVELVFYPQKKGFLERLTDMLATRVVGEPPVWWKSMRAALTAYEFAPGSILTLMPQEIRIR